MTCFFLFFFSQYGQRDTGCCTQVVDGLVGHCQTISLVRYAAGVAGPVLYDAESNYVLDTLRVTESMSK